MMKSRTPLSDLVSGTHNYLKLEGQALRLKFYLSSADTFYGGLRLTAIVAFAAFALAFLGAALALWVGTITTPAAGFAITGGLFLLAIPLALWILSRQRAKMRDRALAIISGEGITYAAAEARYMRLRAEAQTSMLQMEEDLLTIKEKTGRVEKLFTSGETPDSEGAAGRIIRSAAGSLLRYALLPKAGLAGKILAPAITGALIRSAPAKALARGLLSVLKRKNKQ